ncbi:transcription factor IIIB 60 kDa subunit-like isoform X2 [Mangifera indica]|uniref:transcription factor IIIB 60 kDa subunit-like isoform X2 n=3 Tax=Mangifera indica TaxID=29780 RepID=UPI001CFB4B02|nr:transcription factor IIIB 60 kDa subunit-like isoform X2 [Mangifera indica]
MLKVETQVFNFSSSQSPVLPVPGLRVLKISISSSLSQHKEILLCNGAASIVGQCIIQLAKFRGIHLISSCELCGRVLDYYNYSTEVTFVKNASGQSQLSGNLIRTIQSEYGASRERLLERAFDDMRQMKNALGIGDSDEIVHIAKRLYGMAVARNFTRGRRAEQVQASCLYFACREKMKPFLLIDFANYLNVNVYELGGVYLQLCQVLYLADESNIQKQLDPSIFLPKFTDRLLPGGDKKVCSTARDILASMKRNWITTGRKPSGLCGAALYVSALTHGLKFSKSDIVKIVHICEATLTKRLTEFENTDSGSLTIEDFLARNKELQGSCSTNHPSSVSKESSLTEVLCKHKDTGKPFAYGLCRSCYDEFMTISEGLEGGADPPAFQAAERERMAKESAEENTLFEEELDSPVMSKAAKVKLVEPQSNGLSGAGRKEATSNGDDYSKSPRHDAGTEASDESDNFSDIDDLEVDGYLHNEEEQHLKKIIWEEMNREYVEEQAAKEAAAAAAREAFEASFKGNPEELKAARELAAAAQANVAKYKKEKQQKRAAEAKNTAPAQTALEATRQMLNKKRLSSKINYEVLEKLFEDSEDADNTKKPRTESQDNDDKLAGTGKKEHKWDDTLKDGDLGGEDDYNDEQDVEKMFYNELDYENQDDTFDLEDDY